MLIQILDLFLKNPPGWCCETVKNHQKCNEKLENTSGRKKSGNKDSLEKVQGFWYNKGYMLLLLKYAM